MKYTSRGCASTALVYLLHNQPESLVDIALKKPDHIVILIEIAQWMVDFIL